MYKSNMKDLIKSFYTTILSQIFSPCGNYLIAGNLYGEIFVFDLRSVLNPEKEVHDAKQKWLYRFIADENGQICALASTDKFLIVGSKGKILGFEWKHVIHGKVPKIAWTLPIPLIKDAIEPTEVNALLVEKSGKIYAGCGDNKIHVYSLEDGHLIRSLTGHTNYLHDLNFINPEQLASASEDGTVKIWDCRTSKAVSTIEPYKEHSLDRPQLGKWVGCVTVEKDWLLCGGGPKPGLWHLGSMQLTTAFETFDKGVHVCGLHEERVLLGTDKLSQFNLQGDSICSVRSSSSTIYSLVFQPSPHHVMAFAGASPDIDICTNFHYRDQVLSCTV